MCWRLSQAEVVITAPGSAACRTKYLLVLQLSFLSPSQTIFVQMFVCPDMKQWQSPSQGVQADSTECHRDTVCDTPSVYRGPGKCLLNIII